jgi:polar amino acid transport system permease protein
MGAYVNLVNYVPLFLQGIAVTLGAWLTAGIASIGIGTVLGLCTAPQIGSLFVIRSIRAYAFITKGIPAYLQILIFYFVLPSVLHIQISGFVAATAALAICSSGYVIEIVRSGLNAIPKSQWDAAFVLGYSTCATVRRIVIPQLFRTILPALIGELEQLLKSSSLLATIGVTELTRVGMNIISREMNPLPVYGTIACIYLIFSALLTLLMLAAEKRGRYGYR